MALSSEELDVIKALDAQADLLVARDTLLSRYYHGRQRLAQIGLAVPPELRNFELVANWPRVVVDTIEMRQDVKSIIVPGSDVADPQMTDLFLANNLEADLSLMLTDLGVFGRGYMVVGTNEDDPEHPLITVESPREITVDIDARHRRITDAWRRYDPDDGGMPRLGTLYRENETIWVRRDGGKWVEDDRDPHGLGRVPVVLFLNRRGTGDWHGRSEMADVIPLSDGAARTLTNMQLAAETLAVPQRYVLGVAKEGFVDQSGKPLPVWEAYFGKFLANAASSRDVTVGQLPGADLKNFHDTVRLFGQLASSVTGFPSKYFGITTTNPASEGAIRAEESQLVKTVERKNAQVGTGLGWVMGIARRLITGDWDDAQKIHVEWQDPATPTFSQKADALQKLAGGVPIISRQGAWDELGWSEGRKARERAYFEQESSEDYLGLLNAKDKQDAGAEPAASGD